MSTFLKSIRHARIGLPDRKPVLKNEIIEVEDELGAKLLTRTVYDEELEQDVPVWEKSSAAAFKAQKGEPEGEEEQAAPEPVVPQQQSQNTNETNENENDAPDTAKSVKGHQPNVATSGTRLSSEGENDNVDPASTEQTESDDKKDGTTPAAKAPVKPAAKAAAKPAVKRTVAKPAAQRKSTK